MINPYYATNQTLKWTSSNPAVATVDENGWIMTKEVGTTIITASATDGSGVKASCVLTVEAVLIESIDLFYTELMLNDGDVFDFSPSIYPYNATNQKLKWTSSNESVATVDEDGWVVTKKPGKTTITVTAMDGSGVSTTCKLTVSPVMVSNIFIDIENSTLDIGSNTVIAQVSLKLLPSVVDTVIMAVPEATAVTFPLPSTLATCTLEEVHFKTLLSALVGNTFALN